MILLCFAAFLNNMYTLNSRLQGNKIYCNHKKIYIILIFLILLFTPFSDLLINHCNFCELLVVDVQCVHISYVQLGPGQRQTRRMDGLATFRATGEQGIFYDTTPYMHIFWSPIFKNSWVRIAGIYLHKIFFGQIKLSSNRSQFDKN